MRHPTPMLLPSQPVPRDLLIASGASAQTIKSHLRQGTLRRVRHGVYVAGASWPTDPAGEHLLAARAELVAFPGAVISHASAAVVWGLPHPGVEEWWELRPSVTLRRGGTAKSRAGIAVHHLGDLPRAVVTRDDAGYDVTTVARTAVDLAAGLPLPEALVILDAAARQLVGSLVTGPRRPDFLRPALVETSRRLLAEASGTRRAAGLTEAVSRAAPGRESPAESLSFGQMVRAGLPLPLIQHPVQTPLGTVFPDFLWPDQRVIGEVDGLVKYGDPAAVLREKQREQALRDLGYRIVRWLAREIMLAPAAVMERLERTLRA